MNDKQDKQLAFVLILLIALGAMALYLFLQSKGIDLAKITFELNKVTHKQTNSDIQYKGLLKISSTAFVNGQAIPTKYTCNGDDVNPPLSITNVPTNTNSLALTIEDPDAPYKTWFHWIVYNIDPRQKEIKENTVPWNAPLGQNDFGVGEYRGPCPPSGKHKYIFRIYALNSKLDLKPGATNADLLKAMRGHIIDVGELTGTFGK